MTVFELLGACSCNVYVEIWRSDRLLIWLIKDKIPIVYNQYFKQWEVLSFDIHGNTLIIEVKSYGDERREKRLDQTDSRGNKGSTSGTRCVPKAGEDLTGKERKKKSTKSDQ